MFCICIVEFLKGEKKAAEQGDQATRKFRRRTVPVWQRKRYPPNG
jgi:hypothetical protein